MLASSHPRNLLLPAPQSFRIAQPRSTTVEIKRRIHPRPLCATQLTHLKVRAKTALTTRPHADRMLTGFQVKIETRACPLQTLVELVAVDGRPELMLSWAKLHFEPLVALGGLPHFTGIVATAAFRILAKWPR